MKYTLNLPDSARRHFAAAEELIKTDRSDVAGYLYGIATECAVKAMMLQAGIKPLPAAQKRDDPFFQHYPQLQSALRDRLKGRVSSPLHQFVNNQEFLQHWNTDMRYAPGKQIKSLWVKKWQVQAHQTVNSIGT
ncbi:hypothetical protein [Janthinobacterium sp. 78]|uniref:hypothetical protein n=1 Tax=Janthinobacterium sp. 78 TaxID=2135631 RepID=UPI000E31B3DA|nr:hypothetical protein [Janthinobacterium sp. 78]